MFNNTQFREIIVRPTLEKLLLNSPAAEELLIFTCATESEGGRWLKQIKGPALGIYQMEPNTHDDIWDNYIKNKTSLMTILTTNFNVNSVPDCERLTYDLRYATAMCRIHYLRVGKLLPEPTDLDQIWDYYKTYYNTASGAADKIDALLKYKQFISN